MDENFNTPMMQQYMQIKKEYKGYLLFYRMGDFYELFLKDAEIGSQIMDVALTSRSKGSEGRIPMCGVPFHSIDTYLAKVIKAGYKAAICEQITKPQKKVKLVERKVIRIVTPGTITEENLLDQKSNNYILTFMSEKEATGIAYADISTGEFYTKILEQGNLFDELKKINPAEIVISSQSYNDDLLLRKLSEITKNISHYDFDNSNYQNVIKGIHQIFNIIRTETFDLDQNKDKQAIVASYNLLTYLKYIQKQNLKNIQKITKIYNANSARLDIESIQNLELFQSTKSFDNKDHSLFATLDKTHTAMGARLLKDWLYRPLIDKSQINQRLDITETLIKEHKLREELIISLKKINDIPRLLAKLISGTGNARDLQNICVSILSAIETGKLIDANASIANKNYQFKTKTELNEIAYNTLNALTINPPFSIREGNMINHGVDERLDEINNEIKSSKEWITNLEQALRKDTQIANLKVGFNSVFGYYIEVTKSYLDKVPPEYIRKQTLANAERYITQELKEKEEIVLNAQSKINEIEFEVFTNLINELTKYTEQIIDLAQKIGHLDCLICFAINAIENNYIKPIIETNDNYDLTIVEGRHPVVEKTMDVSHFTPNDSNINKNAFLHLITGPNMSGKSTYIRQVAIIQLMAQIGSYVPAKNAHITIVDGIYTRIGSGDALAQGLSTFMVEMIETAKILNNATKNSLVILDEVGRGTSTVDGIAIAQAIVEYIHAKIGCKTLFATHLHELTSLSQRLKKLKNYHIAVLENETEIRFLHKIKEGSTDKSYGIDVAKIAGIPVEVIDRAKAILNKNTTSQLKLNL